MTPIAKPKIMPKPRPRPRPRIPVVELKPKIMPKPRPRPRIPSVPDAILVIDLTADPHSSYHVMDLTGV